MGRWLHAHKLHPLEEKWMQISQLCENDWSILSKLTFRLKLNHREEGTTQIWKLNSTGDQFKIPNGMQY